MVRDSCLVSGNGSTSNIPLPFLFVLYLISRTIHYSRDLLSFCFCQNELTETPPFSPTERHTYLVPNFLTLPLGTPPTFLGRSVFPSTRFRDSTLTRVPQTLFRRSLHRYSLPRTGHTPPPRTVSTRTSSTPRPGELRQTNPRKELKDQVGLPRKTQVQIYNTATVTILENFVKVTRMERLVRESPGHDPEDPNTVFKETESECHSTPFYSQSS